MVHHSTCPNCTSPEIAQKFICTDHFVSHEAFPVDECRACGFTFTQDHPGESEAGRYYESEEYVSHSDTSEGLINKIYRRARSFMLWKKSKLVMTVTGLRTGKILDIGSGTGYFANAMKAAGWHAEGIEISDKAREFSRREFGLEVQHPDDIRKLRNGSYDCITLWHVLEHFHDPDGYMKEISRLLSPGGRCIIALPNNSSFDAAHYQEFWAAWDVPRHLWHFSPATFRKYCEKSMFELIKIKPLPLDIFYVSMLSEKYRGSRLHFMKGMAVGGWFWIKSLFNNERSSSLIYILRKS